MGANQLMAERVLVAESWGKGIVMVVVVKGCCGNLKPLKSMAAAFFPQLGRRRPGRVCSGDEVYRLE